MKQVNLRICRTILPLLLGLFLSVGVYAQNITVKGHVKDALGGVIGANVIEKGNPSNGTITDVDGNFTLSVPCLLYTSPSPRDRQKSRMPSSA